MLTRLCLPRACGTHEESLKRYLSRAAWLARHASAAELPRAMAKRQRFAPESSGAPSVEEPA